MKKTLVYLICSIVLCACNASVPKEDSTTQQILNPYKNLLNNYGIVALYDNGLHQEIAVGGVSHDTVQITATHRFCIGSCTKMFTSVIVLKLQEQGKLKISDSVYRYLPSHKFIDSTITLAHLLNHTSGLTEILKNGFQNEPFINPTADFSDTRLYSRIDTIDFLKGTQYQYCNTNYFLLAKIIEKVTDKSYDMNLLELILNPLQLKNTFPYYANTIENLAHPIIGNQDLHSYPKLPVNRLSQGSGTIVSDVKDLNAFVRALLIDKTLLTAHSLKQMTNFYTYKNTKSGYGLSEENIGGKTLLGHTGRQISYISLAFADTVHKESMIVLTNNANDTLVDHVLETMCKTKRF